MLSSATAQAVRLCVKKGLHVGDESGQPTEFSWLSAIHKHVRLQHICGDVDGDPLSGFLDRVARERIVRVRFDPAVAEVPADDR